MPRITLTVDGKAYDIPDAAVPNIQVHVDRTNAAARTALSLGEWLGPHLQGLAIAGALAAAVAQLQQQQQDDANAALEAAIKAARAELLATLPATATPPQHR